MIVRRVSDCQEVTSGDKTSLREVLHADKGDFKFRYSLAQARVSPGRRTLAHKLKSSEVYYILKGEGLMHVGDESARVSKDCAVYIPPEKTQYIENTGKADLVFLCIVDPAWSAEDEAISYKSNSLPKNSVFF